MRRFGLASHGISPGLRVSVVACLLFVGCSRSSQPGGPHRLRIGAVLPSFNDPFFVALKNGLTAGSTPLGVELTVRDGKDDDLKQIAQVEALISQRVDAIILCPRDEDALVRAVEEANRAGIPVLALNRRVNGGKVAAYVGADDADGGREQARTLAQALGPSGGSIIYLQGTQGSTPQRARGRGFREVLAEHPEISIAEDRYADFRADRAKAVMTALARKHKTGTIRGIVAQNDEMALPAAEVARAEGWDDVVVIGMDGTRAAFAAVREGRLYATILQDADDQGRRAIRSAVDLLQKKVVSNEVITPLPVITKGNIGKYRPSY